MLIVTYKHTRCVIVILLGRRRVSQRDAFSKRMDRLMARIHLATIATGVAFWQWAHQV